MVRGYVNTTVHIRECPVLVPCSVLQSAHRPERLRKGCFQRRTAACRQLCDPRFPPHPTCPGWDSPGHRRWQFSVSPPLPPARRSGHAAPPDAQIPGPLRFLGRCHLTPLSASPGPPRMLPSVGGGTAPGHELGQAGAPALSPSPGWNVGVPSSSRCCLWGEDLPVARIVGRAREQQVRGSRLPKRDHSPRSSQSSGTEPSRAAKIPSKH